MVGWTRRNAEDAARRKAAMKKYNAWYATLTPEQKLTEDARVRDRTKQLDREAIVIVGVLLIMIALLITVCHFCN